MSILQLYLEQANQRARKMSASFQDLQNTLLHEILQKVGEVEEEGKNASDDAETMPPA